MTVRRSSATLRDVKTVQCSCGYVASGETADELLADVEAHIDAAHAVTSTGTGTGAPVKASCPRERSEK